MEPIWKISGLFAGWISSRGEVFNSRGFRVGTLVENVLYDRGGDYLGELINKNYVGRHEGHNDWFGPGCDIASEIGLEPMENLIGIEAHGYSDPLF